MKTNQGGVVEFDVKSIADDGSFSGYASVYGVVDSHRDIVQRGSFAKSLAKRPAAKVKMLRNHDQSEPIGFWKSIVEDDRGLKVSGQLILDTVKGRETYALMKAGALDGLSIGYKTVKDRIDRTKNARILEEIDLWEISTTTFPSNSKSTVTAVKSNHSTQFRALVEAINSARHSLTK